MDSKRYNYFEMKKLFLILILVFNINVMYSQCNCKYKDFWKVAIAAATYGGAQGQMDAMNFHAGYVARVWNTTTDKVDPALTWTWKYVDGDPSKGYKSPFAKYIVLDPWHITKMIQNVSYEVTPALMPNCKMTTQQKWIVPIGIAIIKSVTFSIVYDGIYHK